MLDLGLNVKILPKNTWEYLGKPQLVYSAIQLRMENLYCIFPIGRMENVEIDVVGVMTKTNFEVIEIMGYKDPYSSLLSVDGASNNYVFVDIKRDTKTFGEDGIKLVQPLDPCLGPRYIELVDHNMES
jgi:hypothetical protein